MQNRPKDWDDEGVTLPCTSARMCVRCGKSEYKVVHDLAPEVFHRVFDSGTGVDVEVSYQKCGRCGEEVILTSHYDVELAE